MEKTIQCKNIPELPILEFLNKNPTKWHNRYFGDEYDVNLAFPPNTPEKIVLRKMGAMIRKGLVDGCDCGCRGDFHITDKGVKALKPTVSE